MKPMETPEHFEVGWGYASYRPVGEVSLDEAIDRMIDAVGYSRENHVSKLLLDITGLSGYATPGFWDRYRLVIGAAAKSKSFVTVAVVAPAEVIDPERIGIKIARSRGLVANVFTSESDALAWLLAQVE